MGSQNHDNMIHPVDERLAWPKTTLCIVSNEFCERFSYYGMKTILLLYFLNVLKFDYSTAIVGTNGFNVVCYMMPLPGSILADGFIGKFRTIFILSIVYAFGQVCLAFSSTLRPGSPFHPYVDIAGLVIIAMGTGGIKPCVASFGGDQFEPHQTKMLSVFFSVFYFAINAGSMITTFVSPIFRAKSCLDQDSCYPLAFGVPAVLMVIATMFFMAGSPWYKKPRPKENIFGEVYRATKTAIVNKSRGKSRERDHWLDYYMDTHVCERDTKCKELQRKKRDKSLCQKRSFMEDIKSLLRLLVMYLPACMFWALYDQQGSSWTIQAVQMKSRFSYMFGEINLLPDQMQTLNAVLILAFIPIFQTVVYPLAGMCVKLTPLRKMIAGGVLAALAFVVSAALQFQVNTTLPDMPSDGNGFVSVMNGFANCNITVGVNGNTKITPVHLGANMTLVNDNTKSDPKDRRQMFELPASDTTFNISYTGSDCAQSNLPTEVTYKVVDGATTYLFVGALGTFYSRASTKKPVEGNGEFSLGIDLAFENEYSGHLALCRKNTEGTTKEHPCDPRRNSDFAFYLKGDDATDEEGNKATSPLVRNFHLAHNTTSEKKAFVYNYQSVRPGVWRLYEMYNVPKKPGQLTMSKEEVKVKALDVETEVQGQGGVYLMVLSGTKDKPSKHIFQSVSDNLVPIYWQIPQIAILTAAEILFSITGYEFAYSQAAPSMKSIVQACWLLTTATGDAIIVLFTLVVKINNMAYTQLLYAGMMLVTMIVYALMSIFYYEYNYYTGDDSSDCDDLELETEDLAVDAKDGEADNRRYANDKADPEHNWEDRF